MHLRIVWLDFKNLDFECYVLKSFLMKKINYTFVLEVES
jgi:hypothetical protein